MRWVFPVLLIQLPSLVLAADLATKSEMGPIPVIPLNRKEPVVYEKDIEPILAKKCQSCHNAIKREGQLEMGSYLALLKGGKHGPPLVPGRSAESRLIRLAGRTERPIMPPRKQEPLSPEELALLKLWIDQGAKAPPVSPARPPAVLGALPAIVHPVRAVAISPDKTIIAFGRGNQIHLYNAVTGAFLRSLVNPALITADGKTVSASHLSTVESLAFSPDSHLLASGSYQEVILWNPQTGTVVKKLTGFADRVVALAFSPSGGWLASGGGAPTEDGEIKVFQVSDGKLITDIPHGHSDTVFGVCFSPDGTRIATCGADKFVKVFDVPAGKFVKSFEGHTHHVLDVAWKADGKILASAGADNAIKIWDYEKGEQIRTILDHKKQVTRLQFIGKTSLIVTCSGDQTVRFWNVDNGANVRNFAGNGDFLYGVGVSPDGTLLAAGGEEGIVRLYNGNTGQLIKSLLGPGAELPVPKK